MSLAISWVACLLVQALIVSGRVRFQLVRPASAHLNILLFGDKTQAYGHLTLHRRVSRSFSTTELHGMFLQDYINLYNILRKNPVQRSYNGTEELVFSKTTLFISVRDY